MEDWKSVLHSCWQPYNLAKFANCCQDTRPRKFSRKIKLKAFCSVKLWKRYEICRELWKPRAMLMNLISQAMLTTVLSEALFRIAMAIPYKILEYPWHGFNLDWTAPSSETQAYNQKLKWDQNEVSNKTFSKARGDLIH